jgi:hypothetical protein
MHSLGKHSLGEHEIPNARKVNPGPPVAIPGPHGGSFTRFHPVLVVCPLARALENIPKILFTCRETQRKSSRPAQDQGRANRSIPPPGSVSTKRDDRDHDDDTSPTSVVGLPRNLFWINVRNLFICNGLRNVLLSIRRSLSVRRWCLDPHKPLQWEGRICVCRGGAACHGRRSSSRGRSHAGRSNASGPRPGCPSCQPVGPDPECHSAEARRNLPPPDTVVPLRLAPAAVSLLAGSAILQGRPAARHNVLASGGQAACTSVGRLYQRREALGAESDLVSSCAPCSFWQRLRSWVRGR